MTKFSFEFYVNRDVFSKKKFFLKYLKLLESHSIILTRYDSVERAKMPYNIDDWEQIFDFTQKDDWLFLKGKVNAFLSMSRNKEGLCYIDFYFNNKNSKNLTQLFSFMKAFCNEFDILFGRGCSEAEYDAKHKVTTFYKDGLYSSGYKGASTKQFYQFLPGIYWQTFFGKTLVDFFTKEKLRALPNVNVEFTQNKQAILTLKSNINEVETNLLYEKEIVSLLGEEYFWSREEKERKTILPFLEELKKLPG